MPASAAGTAAAALRPDPKTWRIARSLLVTDSEDEARAYLTEDGNAIHAYYNYLLTQLGRAGARKIFLTEKTGVEEDLTLQAVMDAMVIQKMHPPRSSTLEGETWNRSCDRKVRWRLPSCS